MKVFTAAACGLKTEENDEEAITQMNLLEHDFFIYNDIKEGMVKVVYRKKDGTYGIIVTE